VIDRAAGLGIAAGADAWNKRTGPAAAAPGIAARPE
jgi:hypothetical protein